jgi:hypothetical protein
MDEASMMSGRKTMDTNDGRTLKKAWFRKLVRGIHALSQKL